MSLSLNVDKTPGLPLICPTVASDRVQRRIDSLLDEANAAISRYDWETVLRLDPENSDALAYVPRHPILPKMNSDWDLAGVSNEV